MINSGAIVVASLLKREAQVADRFEYVSVQNKFKKLTVLKQLFQFCHLDFSSKIFFYNTGSMFFFLGSDTVPENGRW